MTVAVNLNVKHIYTSASCNRHQNALDFGENIIIYASCNSVVVYDYKNVKIETILSVHKARVNTVHWIQRDRAFISSSDDKTAIIWTKNDNSEYEFIPKYVLSGHGDNLITANSSYIIEESDNDFLSCVSSADQKLSFWLNDSKLCDIKMTFFVFDVKIVPNHQFFPAKKTAIFLAGSDSNIHLYCMTENKSVVPVFRFEGHEDWIRSVDLVTIDKDTMFLASGSQDNFIRVWKITFATDTTSDYCNRFFTINDKQYAVGTETVMYGHEDKVLAVKWMQKADEPLQLLSASMDKAMILWEKPSDDSDVWLEKLRVGEVGGNTVGFLGCSFSSHCDRFIGHSFNGALHMWFLNKQTNVWQPEEVISGHFGPVKDLSWEPNGRFFLTCSLDETTRLHGKWLQHKTWHEIGRPQVHGYEINCIVATKRWLFASGADEKVLRLFKATKCFVESLKQLSHVTIEDEDESLPEFATVSALGLSNKAASGEAKEEDSVLKPVVFTKPPLEEDLLQNTLWPEVQKLYGHGYELYSVAVNHAATLVASACKAAKEEHASIILWDLQNNFKQVQKLPFHQLTVTQIRFSPNDKLILSVSRDRNLCLHKLNEKEGIYERFCYTDKKTSVHARIIWDCSWAGNQYFVTASRDKKVVWWEITNTYVESSTLGCVKPCEKGILACEQAVTSVDVLFPALETGFLTAIGFENGGLQLLVWNRTSGWQNIQNFPKWHHLAINRIRFSPQSDVDGHLLASASDDGMVRIMQIKCML